MSEMNKRMMGQKIGFVGKGGAGKSTCMTLLAHVLQKRGHHVCILDTDSTNDGLHLALGIKQPPRSLIDHFGGMVFLGGKVACPADDPTLLTQAHLDLEKLPGEYACKNQAGVTLMATGKLTEYGIGAGCDGPMVKIARDLIIRENGQPMTMLIDLKAGIEDMSRGVVTGLDSIMVVCDPSTAGLGVARYIKQMFDQLQLGAEPATSHIESADMVALARKLFRESSLKHIHVIINKVPDQAAQNYMIQQLKQWDMEPFAILPQSTAIQQAWLKGHVLPMDELTEKLNYAMEQNAKLDAVVGVQSR